MESQSTDVNANITYSPRSTTSITTNSTQGRKDPKTKPSDWDVKNPNPVTYSPKTPHVSNTATISTLRTVDTQVLTDFSTQHSSVMTTSSAALPTALVTIWCSHQSSPIQTCCFFDQGSQQTFITKTLQDFLELKPVSKISLSVHHGFNNTTATCEYDVVDPFVIFGKCKKRIYAIVLPALPTAFQTPGLASVASDLKKKDIKLADNYLFTL